MKYFIVGLLFSTFLATNVFAAKNNSKTYAQALKYNLWHTTLSLMMSDATKNATLEPKFLAQLELTLTKINPTLLSIFPSANTNKIDTDTFNFYRGKESYLTSNYNDSISSLQKVSPSNLNYPESQLMLANIFNKNKKFKKMITALRACTASSRGAADRYENIENLKTYFEHIENSCLVFMARFSAKKQRYTKALNFYTHSNKRSTLFTSVILEKAWVYYLTGDYNRALGQLVTYKSPLLTDYLLPEAEYLSALSYYNLCLWQDSAIIIQNYYTNYSKSFKSLNNYKAEVKKNPFIAIESFLNPKHKLRADPYINKFLDRTGRLPFFISALDTLRQLEKEIAFLESQKKATLLKRQIPNLQKMKNKTFSLLAQSLLREANLFTAEAKKVSEAFYLLKLEIISKKKDLLYSNKVLESNRSRGDLSYVKRDSEEYFWHFDGEFWADELGDYSFGLKSNCGLVDKKGAAK